MDNIIRHHTILISDVHLGSPMCQANELLDFLERIEVKYLIINGDLFEDLTRTHRLKGSHWKIMSQLRKMSDHCEVVWVKGNHDTLGYRKDEDIDYIGNLLGLNIKKEFFWKVGDHNYCAVHGDFWDNYLYKYPIASKVITWIYDRMKEANSEWMKGFTRWMKNKSKILLRNGNYVMEGALTFAVAKGVKGIFCGHTHRAELIERNKFVYGNTGTFESADPTFIAVDENEVSLYRYMNGQVTMEKQIDLYQQGE